MKFTLATFWNNLTNIPASDPNQVRRGRLLNIMLFGLFLTFLGALVYSTFQAFFGRLDWETTLTYITTLIMLVGTVAIYLINRFRSSATAAIIFLCLITATIFFADTPHESIWGRNMIPFVIPIIMASVIWHQAASFIVAGLIVIISITLASGEHMSINFIGAFAYLSIAWISWLSARTLENALEEARNYLQQLKKAQAQLIRQERLAALGQLSGSIAHELRNPLGAIKNATFVIDQMWLETQEESAPQPSEDVRLAFDIIQREVTTSERIITNLLDFTRAKPPICTWANLHEILEASLQRVHLPNNITVRLQLALGAPRILCDPDQLAQVFINLITNSIQAMPGQGELTVQTQIKFDKVQISITDTGEGISKENMKNLFEPLFTTKARGMGLGLSICQKILDSHHGQIELKSTAGQGTTAYVRLPIQAVPYTNGTSER